METQIRCENVTLGYGAHILVERLSFAVEKGDYLCIVGENGAGKSTLLRTILGLQEPLAGAIMFGGGLRRKEIGYLPQQTFVQRDFPASVREVVLSGCQGRCGWRPFYNREEKKLADKAMEQMEVSQLEKVSYRDLSGGQQQRVLLARALCASDVSPGCRDQPGDGDHGCDDLPRCAGGGSVRYTYPAHGPGLLFRNSGRISEVETGQ